MNSEKTKGTDHKNIFGIRHIAFTMDGNGRWATRRGMPREYGHKHGARAFRDIVKYCRDIGVKYVTVYAFSTENWKRPKSEVDSIMRLLSDYLTDCEREMSKYDIAIRFIGDLEPLDNKLRQRIERVTQKSRNGELVLNIALNYGGRGEIIRALNLLAASGKKDFTIQDVEGALYTSGCPDPDLIIRTAGEYRISNFLLWQCSYSELYFTDTLWPDFGPTELDRAIEEYGRRRRKYGGI